MIRLHPPIFLLATLFLNACNTDVEAPPQPLLPEITFIDTETLAYIKKCHQEALEAINDPSIRLNYARCLLANGFSSLAIKEYKSALSCGSPLGNTWYELGLAALKSEELELAIKAFNKSINYSKNTDLSKIRLAIAQVDLGDLKNAKNTLTDVSCKNKNPDLILTKAKVDMQLGNHQVAINLFECLENKGTTHPYIYSLKARCHRQLGNLTMAEKIDPGRLANKSYSPNDPIAAKIEEHGVGILHSLKRVDRMASTANFDSAYKELQKIETNTRAAGAIATRKINLLRSMGKIKEAQQVATKILRKNPNDETMHLNLSMLFEKENPTRAFQHAIKAIEIRPKFSDAHLQVGRLWLLKNNYEKAEKALYQAFNLGASNPKERGMYGKVLAKLGKFKEACVQLETSRMDLPTDPSVWIALAFSTADKGDLDKARIIAKNALNRFPNNAQIKSAIKTLNGPLK